MFESVRNKRSDRLGARGVVAAGREKTKTVDDRLAGKSEGFGRLGVFFDGMRRGLPIQ